MQPTSKQPQSPTDEQVSLEDCLLKLLRGIQNNAVIADGPAGQQFQADLSALEGRLQAQENASLLVASAVEILNKYGTQANQAIARQKSGLARAMEHWNAVDEQIQAISTKDDFEAGKARVATQIALARTESLRVLGDPESQESGNAASEPARASAVAYAANPLTGLPSRVYAEVELARAQAQSKDCYLALFVVKRLALINAKFGYARGDQVLLKVVVHLAQFLPEFNKLFRWAPCAFLSVASPDTT